jgi:hypothetical protein
VNPECSVAPMSGQQLNPQRGKAMETGHAIQEPGATAQVRTAAGDSSLTKDATAGTISAVRRSRGVRILGIETIGDGSRVRLAGHSLHLHRRTAGTAGSCDVLGNAHSSVRWSDRSPCAGTVLMALVFRKLSQLDAQAAEELDTSRNSRSALNQSSMSCPSSRPRSQ